MVLQIGGQNSEITITLPDRIAIKVCKEFKVRVRSKTIIGKLSQIKFSAALPNKTFCYKWWRSSCFSKFRI